MGREGNSQKIEFDIYINGGIDWYSPLVRLLGRDYPGLVKKTGGWYNWNTEGVELLYSDGTAGQIDVGKKYREDELGRVINSSSHAKEIIRKAFGIPDMPPPEVEEVIAEVNKTKRKKRSELDLDGNPQTSYQDE